MTQSKPQPGSSDFEAEHGAKRMAVGAPNAARRALRRARTSPEGGDAPGLNAVIRAFVKSCEELGIGGARQRRRLRRPHPPGAWSSSTAPAYAGFAGAAAASRLLLRANPFAYPVRDARGRERLVDVSCDRDRARTPARD